MSFDALFDGSDANLLPDDFETFWHSQPFGWAACDAMTLAKKVWAAAVTTEREACAKICEALPLTIPEHNYTAPGDRHVMAVAEAGCRGAFADAIRMRSNLNSKTPDVA